MGKISYVEPAEYFPKEIRKDFKLGEYFEAKEIDIAMAAEIAQEYIGDYIKLTRCDERENAFVFKDSSGEETIGGDLPVFVLKKDGSVVGTYEYHEMIGPRELVAEYILDEDGFWKEKE